MQQRLTRAENIAAAQQGVIQSLNSDLTVANGDIQRLMNGAEIVCRALDEMYHKSRELFINTEMSEQNWNEFYRTMLRGDIGFAILNGANFVDLTADEDIEDVDGEETETEDEGIEEEESV